MKIQIDESQWKVEEYSFNCVDALLGKIPLHIFKLEFCVMLTFVLNTLHDNELIQLIDYSKSKYTENILQQWKFEELMNF